GTCHASEFCPNSGRSPQNLPQKWEAHDLHRRLHRLALLLAAPHQHLLPPAGARPPHRQPSMLLITSPTSTEYSYLLMSIQKNIGLFFGLEWVFVLLYSLCSILFSTATIYASAIAHGGKNLSATDLARGVARSWTRPFITFFYITLFGVGYLFLVVALMVPLVLPRAKIATVTLCILAALFYAHLAVVWTLGLVVSVLEEDKSGLEALAKAGRLVKGREVHGFALSLVIVALSILTSQAARFVSIRQSNGAYVVIGLVMLNSLWTVRMLGLMAYTVFYYECKKFHGEEGNDSM
ncbi:uncharacterized protein J3R85_010790, partial [Psidium guajava]